MGDVAEPRVGTHVQLRIRVRNYPSTQWFVCFAGTIKGRFNDELVEVASDFGAYFLVRSYEIIGILP